MTEEFQALETEWAGIVQRQDQAAAERFLADDYVLTSVGGASRHMPRETGSRRCRASRRSSWRPTSKLSGPTERSRS